MTSLLRFVIHQFVGELLLNCFVLNFMEVFMAVFTVGIMLTIVMIR